MLRFSCLPMEAVRLFRDPRFWEIVARGFENSIQFKSELQEHKEATTCLRRSTSIEINACPFHHLAFMSRRNCICDRYDIVFSEIYCRTPYAHVQRRCYDKLSIERFGPECLVLNWFWNSLFSILSLYRSHGLLAVASARHCYCREVGGTKSAWSVLSSSIQLTENFPCRILFGSANLVRSEIVERR